MAARRSRRLSSSHQNVAADEEFTSGEKFVFDLDESVGRLRRSRRSSISLTETKPPAKARRQTMLPAVTEEKTKIAGKENKKKAPSRPAVTAKKALTTSPTKKFSKILKEEDILKELDFDNDKKAVSPASKAKPAMKSRIPIKSPPSASKKQQNSSAVRRSRRISGDIQSLPPLEKPATKRRRQTMLPAISEQKSPLKPQPKSPKVDNVLKDVKKVEIKLRKMKIREDPNLIFSLLEDSTDEDRVEDVVGKIIKTKEVSSPVTRQRKTATPVVKTPSAKVKTPSVKVKTPTPAAKPPAPKVKTPAPKIKTPKAEMREVLSSKKRKQTESTVTTPVQNKRLKLDKTGSENKDPEKSRTVVPQKKTPTLVSKYKQKTPVSSLRKPLKRLQMAKNTPVQVRPSDVLRRNMIRKVEKEIVEKLSKKPDSSPYTLASGETSPVFKSVDDVKSHLTGTPARTRARRKFGTVVQPYSLLEESVAPGTDTLRRVSSSTPVRPIREGAHPLEAVEATPIRPPVVRPTPLSPPPEMVTGKLGYLCSIM